MNHRQEAILQMIENAKKNTYDAKMLAASFSVSSHEELMDFREDLKTLEEEKLLFVNKKNKYSTRKQNAMREGILKVTRKGAGYVDFEDISIRLESFALLDAMDGDTVLLQIHESPYGSDYGVVVKVLKRAHTQIVGTYKVKGNTLQFVPDDEKLTRFRYVIKSSEAFRPLPGLKVRMHIESYGERVKLRYESTLGFKDDPGVDILSVLLEHEIEPEFPEEVKKEVQQIPDQVSKKETEGRVNLTADNTITIDGDDSKDFDDAVYVERVNDGWILKVSIADVAHYVKEGSAIDREAYKRGTSVYVTDRVVPMLPRNLSNGICSLNPDVVRLTNTCQMHVLFDGQIQDYRVYSSYILSHRRMTYHNVNLMLAGNQEALHQFSDIRDMVSDLRDCADAIRKQRVRKGAIDFDTKESIVVCDASGKAVDVHAKQRGHAEEIIEDCMIAANVCVADLMQKEGIPCLYRIHEDPLANKLREFSQKATLFHAPFRAHGGVTPKEVQEYLHGAKENENYPILSMALLRCMQKAVYSERCVGHYGLAEKEYLHFTSPIRRYPDLIVHRMLEKYYYSGKKDTGEDAAKMADYGAQCSALERNASDAEYECMDMKKAEYMQSHIGEVWTGIISSVMSYGFYVRFDNTVEGIVHVENLQDDYYEFDSLSLAMYGVCTHRVYRIGDSIRVKILSANKEERIVELKPEKCAKKAETKKKVKTHQPKKKVGKELHARRKHQNRR